MELLNICCSAYTVRHGRKGIFVNLSSRREKEERLKKKKERLKYERGVQELRRYVRLRILQGLCCARSEKRIVESAVSPARAAKGQRRQISGQQYHLVASGDVE